MKERLRYRSWTIGAKTLVSHALLALFAIVFACVVAYALSFRYVQDQAMEELVAQAEYIASCDATEGTELLIPDEKTIEQYQRLTSSMVLYVNPIRISIHRRRRQPHARQAGVRAAGDHQLHRPPVRRPHVRGRNGGRHPPL